MKKQTYWEDVFAVTKLVPQGRVTTYGAIADYLRLGSPRMVGWALNHAHGETDVPAQRVVNRNGELSGRNHFATPTLMAELLITEGVNVVDNKIQNFKEVFWHPLADLAEDADLEK
jgi:methylated-DNA-protein-cysteine methyltransferase related protein